MYARKSLESQSDNLVKNKTHAQKMSLEFKKNHLYSNHMMTDVEMIPNEKEFRIKAP